MYACNRDVAQKARIAHYRLLAQEEGIEGCGEYIMWLEDCLYTAWRVLEYEPTRNPQDGAGVAEAAGPPGLDG